MRHLRFYPSVAAAVGAASLFGCVSWAPDKVELLVSTLPPGASCVVSRGGQPIASVEPTPAIAQLDPAAGDVAISCHRRGFQDAAVTLPPAQITTAPFWAPGQTEYQNHVHIALVPR